MHKIHTVANISLEKFFFNAVNISETWNGRKGKGIEILSSYSIIFQEKNFFGYKSVRRYSAMVTELEKTIF